jgi:hypothetical protein
MQLSRLDIVIMIQLQKNRHRIKEYQKRDFKKFEKRLLVCMIITLSVLFIVVMGNAVQVSISCNKSVEQTINYTVVIVMLVLNAILGINFICKAKSERSIVWKKQRLHVSLPFIHSFVDNYSLGIH